MAVKVCFYPASGVHYMGRIRRLLGPILDNPILGGGESAALPVYHAGFELRRQGDGYAFADEQQLQKWLKRNGHLMVDGNKLHWRGVLCGEVGYIVKQA